jgi:SAM-dependent methyltransferase
MNDQTQELQTIYQQRFEGAQAYRNQVWQVLIRHFFQKFIPRDAAVLDLGCGYGEFINQVSCRKKYGMDLNPTTARVLAPDVQFLQQDCSSAWSLPENSLDVVFTSNFFEHLPNKQTLGSTLDQARRCLKPGGKLIAMGPNIKYVPGKYWDFWDHYLPLTELSLSEGLRNRGFEIVACYPRFLPYTMVNAPQYPLFLLRIYLSLSWFWPCLGQQFMVVASRPK